MIYAAEEVLQLLSPRTIEPERAQFITTPLNVTICRNHAESRELAGLALGPWVDSMVGAVETGATFSHGFPITPASDANALGQCYFGPIVLITDPLCYSATDMFAAGFQDHRIGTLIGVGGATGAGGANVWTHGLLSQLVMPDNLADPGPSPYKPLPRGSDMRVAARRTVRVGPRQGDILEDLGVKPDMRYQMSRRDILDGNQDLIDTAIAELERGTSHPLSVVLRPRPGRLPLIVVDGSNITRIESGVVITTPAGDERRSFASQPVGSSPIELDPEQVVGSAGNALFVDVAGYAGDELVARRRTPIAVGA